MKELFELFMIFFKMGAFTFGGGYAMLPIIQEEIVNRRSWATDEEILDIYAIGQSTPGIIAINTATFIGYDQQGIIGAIVSTLGMVTPSIIIITTIAAFFKNFQNYIVIQYALKGIRVVVAALILNAVIKMYKDSVKDWMGIILFMVSFLLFIFLDITPIIVIIASAIIGIIRFKSIEM